MRFEVVHVYSESVQHCFFLPLPHMPLEFKFKMLLPPAKDPGLHKGNTGSQTLDYGLLPKGVDSYGDWNDLPQEVIEAKTIDTFVSRASRLQ